MFALQNNDLNDKEDIWFDKDGCKIIGDVIVARIINNRAVKLNPLNLS